MNASIEGDNRFREGKVIVHPRGRGPVAVIGSVELPDSEASPRILKHDCRIPEIHLC